MVPAGKSLEDQVREIQKLIADARETLAQAEWALETLAGRIHREEEQEHQHDPRLGPGPLRHARIIAEGCPVIGALLDTPGAGR